MLEKPKKDYTYTLTRTSTKNKQINGANCFDLSEIRIRFISKDTDVFSMLCRVSSLILNRNRISYRS